jgi:hypothetical protein
MRLKNNWYDVKSILRQVERLIRTRKTITIAFVVSLILTQLCGSCTDTSKSDYVVKTIGSCHRQTSMRIIDETGGIDSSRTSVKTRRNTPFKFYVNTISKHVFTKIDEMGLCQKDGQGDPEVELVFIYRPIVSHQIPPFKFERTRSDDTQQVDSPWVQLTMNKSPRFFLRAAFLLNERQFLFDQALLSDTRAVPTNPLIPFNPDTYSQFLDDYKNAVLLAPSKEVQDAAQVNISKRLPADILWLFRHAGQIEGVLSNRQAIWDTLDRGSAQYIELTLALLKHRLASVQIEQRYNSVLDLKDVFNIDKYRIKSLH